MLGDTFGKPLTWGVMGALNDERIIQNPTYDVFQSTFQNGLLYVSKIDQIDGNTLKEAQENYRVKKNYAVDFHYANRLMLFPVGTVHDGCLDDQVDCG